MSEDASQLAVINSSDRRMFVEAPAGYGKTTTMVKKIANDFQQGVIPWPKRILALTYSVNAARKMKNDIRSELAKTNMIERASFNRIDVYNYHALARRILSVYSLPILGISWDMNNYAELNESQVLGFFQASGMGFSQQDNEILIRFAKAVRECDLETVESLIGPYNALMERVLLPHQCITYNGIITLAAKLLSEQPSLQAFYQAIYSYIIVDEAQDTNLLSYKLLKLVIGDDSRVYMFGDSLQRIYGFIGAISDFTSRSQAELELLPYRLTTNHRFAKGSSMQLLDINLRENIRNPKTPSIEQNAMVPLFFQGSIGGEIRATCDIAKTILTMQPDASIAILLRSRGFYGSTLPKELKTNGLDCFDALFDDTDQDYIAFNELCIHLLGEVTGHSGKSSLSDIGKFVNVVENEIDLHGFAYGTSYKLLLRALASQIEAELTSTTPQVKYEFIINVFENRTLRHALAYIPSRIILTTMHAAKGLEWDYVIIPETMQWTTPSYAVCKDCTFERKACISDGHKCTITMQNVPNGYIDELCVFYVAVTRARRNVIFLATTDRINKIGEHKTGLLSCFLQRPGIVVAKVNNLVDLVL